MCLFVCLCNLVLIVQVVHAHRVVAFKNCPVHLVLVFQILHVYLVFVFQLFDVHLMLVLFICFLSTCA